VLTLIVRLPFKQCTGTSNKKLILAKGKFNCRDQKIEDLLEEFDKMLVNDQITASSHAINIQNMLRQGVIEPKNKNPLKGKGYSYANHVDGPDGWGKYIIPERSLPEFSDDGWADNVWNDGKW